MTSGEALTKAITDLSAAGVGSSRLDSELLLAHVLTLDRAIILAHPEQELSSDQATLFLSLVAKRALHHPLVHLTHSREFYGLDFYINADVLTPRVETETMAEWAIELAPQSSKLIDIGTGSGALAVAIKKHRPDLDVTASEVTTEALAIATKNVKSHQIKINLVQSDLWDNVDDKFATVVTNLPYLVEGAELMPEVQKEPAVALFGGQGDGLDLYRRFLAGLLSHLEPGGILFTESDPWQHEHLIAEAAKYKMIPIATKNNYFILGFQHAD